MNSLSRKLRTPLLLLVPLCLLASAAGWAEFRESFTFGGRSLSVANLIGAVQIEGHGGGEFEVEVVARGRDADRDRLRVESRKGARSRLAVVFPLEESRRYVYPEIDGRTTFELDRPADGDESWLREMIESLSSRRIRVSGSGSGLEIWADVTIRVPSGGSVDLRHGVGRVEARNVDGDVRLEVESGGVDVQDVVGSLTVDTGSGSVALAQIRGELAVDTGSGKVTLVDYDGPDLEIDTGSGSVEVTRIRSRRVVIDTGSGGVRAERVSAEEAAIDTGSGSVTLALDEMGPGEFEIDTGSGSITLLVPASISAEVKADTGSGGIDVELGDISTLYRERHEMRFRVGDGAARVRLDTGSGSIRIAENRL